MVWLNVWSMLNTTRKTATRLTQWVTLRSPKNWITWIIVVMNTITISIGMQVSFLGP
jgi:hypothetical protein